MDDQSEGQEHRHESGHSHGHGNVKDRGPSAMWRYARHARRMWRSEVNDAVVALVAPSPGETVLDIGAGVGAGTVVAAKAGATVVAVEPTPYMRRTLQARRLLQKARGSIDVVDGAAESLNVVDDLFDAAWAVNTMHHWVDLDAGAVELARVLKPGGRAVLVDEDFDDPSHPEYERFQNHRHGGGESDEDDDDDHGHHFHLLDAATVRAAMVAAGLDVVTADKQDLIGRPVVLVEVHRPSEAAP